MDIPVYADYEHGEIIARVSYNTNLDYWDGNNMTCGGTGLHKGLTRLKKSGDYVLVHTSQWQGSRDYAEVISPKQAVQEILKSGNHELFEAYPELKTIMEIEFDEEA